MRKATRADADAEYLDLVGMNLKDALIEEGWLAHGDVGMPGTTIGGGLKDPKMRTLHNKKVYLEKCIKDGAHLFEKASQTPTALTPKETSDLKKLEKKRYFEGKVTGKPRFRNVTGKKVTYRDLLRKLKKTKFSSIQI